MIANELASLVPSRLADWQLTPNGSEGYKKAEITVGGVDMRDLSSQTMESKQAGLYFIGEVVDVTGFAWGICGWLHRQDIDMLIWRCTLKAVQTLA